MVYKNCGGTIAVRMDRGEDILEKLEEIALSENIMFASITAIGAVDEFEAGTYDLRKKEYRKKLYRGSYEIVSLCGNITSKDGKPYLHLHIACSDETGKTIGGHLTKARVSVTCEMFILSVPNNTGRIADEQTGINIMEL